MKTHDIILDAMMHPDLRKEYEKKGYKYLNSGQDVDVFLAPDGSITKIFGTGSDSSEFKFTKAQRSFIDFADYCRKHSDNPYLPQIQSWKKFEYPKGSNFWYLAINVERLFDFGNAIGANGETYNYNSIASELEKLGGYIHWYGATGPEEYLERVDVDIDSASELIMNLGEEGFRQLSQALADLFAIAKRKGYEPDLHAGNFMLSSEGHMVINDPFFARSWRDIPSR